MKKVIVLFLGLCIVLSLTSCTKKQGALVVNTVQTTAVSATDQKEMDDNVAAVYAAFLAQYDGYEFAYAADINADGYPEVIAKPENLAQQFVLTYTEKGGLSVLQPNAYSSMGVHFYVSNENCLYYTDDGHTTGTASYHAGYVYAVQDMGFSLVGKAYGDEWTETISSDADIERLDEKYDRIFENKIQEITGDKDFVDCAEFKAPEDTETYLNDALGVNLARVRAAYSKAEEACIAAVEKAGGQAPDMVYVSDYDRDGAYESFAVVLTDTNTDYVRSAEIWFVNVQGIAEQLTTSDDSSYIADQAEILSCTYHDYFQIPVFAASAAPSLIWTVQQGRCEIVEISSENSMEILQKSDSVYFPDLLISTHNTYDMLYMPGEDPAETFGTGHTHKPYFFHDTPGGLREYGGIKVSEQEIASFAGGEDLLKLAQQDGKTIESIYYRENGIFNFSMTVKDEYDNTEYSSFNALLKDNAIELLNANALVSESDFDADILAGFYLPAVSPKTADYPKTIK